MLVVRRQNRMPLKQKIDLAIVRALMHDPKSKRFRLWTASLIVERLGIAHYPRYPKDQLKRAANVLETLWKTQAIIKRLRLDHRFTLREPAYMHLDDAPSAFYRACEKCGSPILTENNLPKPCPSCVPAA